MMKSLKLIRLIFTLLLTALVVACSEPTPYQENEHYTVFDHNIDDVIKQQPQLAEAVVFEFFTYGCTHCQSFAPTFDKWVVKQDIKAVYIPVVWSDTTELHAKAFYLIQDKPEFKTLHAGLFKLVAGFSRTDSLEEQKIALIDWFQKQGIQPIDTLQALDSSQFEQELANSLLLTKRFKVTGTPALVVNQKYRINNDALTSQQEMLSVAEGLMK